MNQINVKSSWLNSKTKSILMTFNVVKIDQLNKNLELIKNETN